MLSLTVSWILFPLLLAVTGAGWGVLIERTSGVRVASALVVPLGLAGAIVIASLLTAWNVTAPAATPVVGAGALAGLLIAWPFRRLALWPVLTALAVLLVYGAPVLFSGSTTFAGYIRLDDTATWLAITDHVMGHGRSLADLPSSTYSLLLGAYSGGPYPLGAFMLLGVGHGLSGIDSAWIFQPYLAFCGAAVGLGVYALVEPIVASPRLRALVAFLAAQPALLYGYSLWGGIKELTAAFLLVLGAALLAQVIARRPASPRGLLPVAVAAGALIVTLGAGAAAWVLPALAGVLVVGVLRARRAELWVLARDVGLLGATTALFALPMWVVLRSFIASDSKLFASGQPVSENLGNLLQPLSGWQLAGIWPMGDFRLRAPTLATALLVALVVLAAVLAIWLTARRRQFSILAYVAIALAGCLVFYLVGSTAWVIGKTLAIASPALLAAALAGGVLLYSRNRVVGTLIVLALAGGTLWSNALAYHDVLLAPRARLSELQHIGGLLAGKGPTFIDDYEVYADRHFLREGAPVEPAEYRSAILPLRDGAILTKSAWADIDSFEPATLMPYRSIVLARSPAQSRPPSIYSLRWRGRYYELWQRPATPTSQILTHVPFGDSNTLPFCGAAQNQPARWACSIDPAASPPCGQIESLARMAAGAHAELVAYQRPEPVVARADQTRWPENWAYYPASHTLWANTPGTLIAHINVYGNQRYELWLGGSFSRGFDVSVDGHYVGRVKDELANIGDYAPVAEVFLTPGIHTFALTYPHSDLTPGSGDNQFTSLTAIVLEPLQRPRAELLTVAPTQARTLCGRTLDWVEVVALALGKTGVNRRRLGPPCVGYRRRALRVRAGGTPVRCEHLG